MNHLTHSVYINAPQKNIWKILIDVENWKQWDKDVKSATLHGSFAIGTKGTLVSLDNQSSTFFITEIDASNHYSNYYQYPFFTQLRFTHKIEPQMNACKVTFLAKFVGPLGWYFAWKQRKAIRTVMKNAMANLISICGLETEQA